MNLSIGFLGILYERMTVCYYSFSSTKNFEKTVVKLLIGLCVIIKGAHHAFLPH